MFVWEFTCLFYVFCFKQKTAYEMRISDLSSDVCSSDLASGGLGLDASASGYALAPFGICCIVAPLFVASLRRLFGAGLVLFAASLVAVAGPALLLVSGGGILMVGIAMGTLGFGIGLLLTPSFVLVGHTVAPHRVAGRAHV